MNYLERPVLDTRPEFGEITSGVLDDFTFSPVTYGMGTPWKVTEGPKRLITYPFAFASRKASGDFRRFFMDRQGRRAGFWLPIYLLDYKLAADVAAGETELTISGVGLGPALAGFAQFGHIVLATWSSLTECAKIASISTGVERETLTLEEPILNDWTAGRSICGGLIYARASDDSMTYSYPSAEGCRAVVKFVELPAEYSTPAAGAARVYLYSIRRGALTWRYTDCGASIQAGGYTWAAADITHGVITAGMEMVSEPVEMRVATDDPGHPLRALMDRTTLAETFVTVYETDLDTLTVDESAPVFKGRIEDFQGGERGLMTFQVSSADRIAELVGPRVLQKRTCNHRTYSEACGLVASEWSTSGTITALSSAYVEAVEFGSKAAAESDPNWFALGLVTSGTEQRLCTGQDGARLYLNAPFRAAVIGDSVSALAGDDRRIGTCHTKFNKSANFLGCPYMPNQSSQIEALNNPKPTGGKKG